MIELVTKDKKNSCHQRQSVNAKLKPTVIPLRHAVLWHIKTMANKARNSLEFRLNIAKEKHQLK